MSSIQIFDDTIILAGATAEHAIAQLQDAIDQHGTATWVLAGGSTPNLAYEYMRENCLDALDWSKVTFIIGDERIGPLDSADNNWHGIHELFLQYIPEATFLRPQSDLSTEEAAAQYETQLQSLARFDLVWLGMGPDGHTLSLFPGHDINLASDKLVIPVHNSPKPPSDRISLTLKSLEMAVTSVILAAGSEKSEAVATAQRTDSDLPIAQVARITNAQWFIDKNAASKL